MFQILIGLGTDFVINYELSDIINMLEKREYLMVYVKALYILKNIYYIIANTSVPTLMWVSLYLQLALPLKGDQF